MGTVLLEYYNFFASMVQTNNSRKSIFKFSFSLFHEGYLAQMLEIIEQYFSPLV